MKANDSKSLEKVFGILFPALSVCAYYVAVSLVFQTVSLTLEIALYNIVLSGLILGLALMLARRYHVAAFIAALTAFLLFYADQCVYAARLTHIRFSDWKLTSQALRVANRYSLPWNADILQRLLVVVAVCAFLVFVSHYYDLNYSKKSVFAVGVGLFLVSGLVVVSGIIPSANEDFDFTADAENRGLLYSWYCQAKESKMQEPEGYSRQEAEQILSRYEATAGDSDVNVIVVMNESLTDYSLLGTLRFSDPLPFLHGLVESGEAFEGKLAVSVYGGNTATTEYEFLTGHSAAFFLEGVSPYLQYVNRATENLSSELKQSGYDTTAIHPYYSEEWNRSQVYRFFGFDRFISGVDFGSTVEINDKNVTSRPSENIVRFGDGPLYVRGLISDQTSYERVLEEMTGKAFVFNVTMQNHGGYDYEGGDFTSTEYVTSGERREWTGKRSPNSALLGFFSEDTEEEVLKVNQYLTCANLSDQALAFLLRELEQREQKTMVLLFGDHQPGLMIPEHYVDADESVNLDYTVPYLLWANYDVEFDAPEITSPNYLSAVLKKNAGLGLTQWDQFRLETMEEFPVVTANCILDKGGTVIDKGALKDYERIQYMRMVEE